MVYGYVIAVIRVRCSHCFVQQRVWRLLPKAPWGVCQCVCVRVCVCVEQRSPPSSVTNSCHTWKHSFISLPVCPRAFSLSITGFLFWPLRLHFYMWARWIVVDVVLHGKAAAVRCAVRPEQFAHTDTDPVLCVARPSGPGVCRSGRVSLFVAPCDALKLQLGDGDGDVFHTRHTWCPAVSFALHGIGSAHNHDVNRASFKTTGSFWAGSV